MPTTTTKILISAGALGLLLLHTRRPELLRQDRLAMALLAMAALPWIFSLVQTAELPGGWKVQFRELQKEQVAQRREIESLRFLVSHFITDDALGHLRRLAAGSAFPYQRHDSFVSELRRLRSLGLIANWGGTSLAGMPWEGDLREHFTVTERGQSYSDLRLSWEREHDTHAPAA